MRCLQQMSKVFILGVGQLTRTNISLGAIPAHSVLAVESWQLSRVLSSYWAQAALWAFEPSLTSQTRAGRIYLGAGLRSNPLQKTLNGISVAKSPCGPGLITHRNCDVESGPGAVVLATFARGAESRRGENLGCGYKQNVEKCCSSLRIQLPFSVAWVCTEPLRDGWGVLAQSILAWINSIAYKTRQPQLQDTQHKV